MHQDSNIDLKLNKFGSPLIDYIKASGAKQVPRVAGDMHSEPHDSRNPTKDVTQKRVNVTSSISSTDQRRLTGFQASALASRLLADPSKPLDTQSAEIADHVGNLTLNNDDTLVDDVLQKGLDEGRGSFLCRISLSPPLNSQPPELSVEKITHAVESSGCQITLVHQDLTAVYLLIRRPVVHICDISEVRVCVVGNVDAGKSTLLGCLTRDTLDDGRGKSRLCMFRHKHEIETGRTSSVGSELMGFDSQGSIVPFLKRPQDVLLNAAKIITFMDLAGHEKYLKTTVFGITGHMPDYVMLMYSKLI